MTTDVAAAVRFKRAVPQFTVPDVVKTAQYYRDVLGFHVASYWDGEQASLATKPPPYFAIVWRDDVQLFLGCGDHAQAALANSEGGYHAYFHITGVDALAEELRARGATILDDLRIGSTTNASWWCETAMGSCWRSERILGGAPPNMHLKPAGVIAPKEAVGSCPGGHGTSSTASCADGLVARCLSAIR